MIHDSTPHRVFKIGELTRLIAIQLVRISQPSAVSLACACRYLEEPVLSTLWEKQRSMHTLLEVLPDETWCTNDTLWGSYLVRGIHPPPSWRNRTPELMLFQFKVVGDPSPEAWDRVRRYASWMRAVRIDENSAIGKDTFCKLRLNSPPGGWFPSLRWLSWSIARSNIPYVADLFFSSHLKRVSISVALWLDDYKDVLPAIASAISTLPTTTLQFLVVSFSRTEIPWAHFEDSFSSVVLRCGNSLTQFISPIPLSDTAINHLIQLPRLDTLRIKQCPPPDSTASLSPTVLSPLTQLVLEQGATRGWLSLFKRLEHGVSATQGVTPLSKMKESLRTLDAETTTVDFALTSPIQMFRNLVSLRVSSPCDSKKKDVQCTFGLNDDDIAELAMALSQLEFLRLGHTCSKNTCATTVVSLLSISVHCIEMTTLEVLFNTTNIVEDFKKISKDPRLREMRSLPKCQLSCLDVWMIPLDLDDLGFETVVYGLMDIFPSLEDCQGLDGNWEDISSSIRELRE